MTPATDPMHCLWSRRHGATERQSNKASRSRASKIQDTTRQSVKKHSTHTGSAKIRLQSFKDTARRKFKYLNIMQMSWFVARLATNHRSGFDGSRGLCFAFTELMEKQASVGIKAYYCRLRCPRLILMRPCSFTSRSFPSRDSTVTLLPPKSRKYTFNIEVVERK